MRNSKIMGLFALMLAVAVLFSACGKTDNQQSAQNSQGSSPAAGQAASEAPKDNKGFHIALLDGTNQNPWRTQFEDQMNQLADQLKKDGILTKYDTFVAQNDPAVQAQQMEQLINAGADAIIINPVSATSLAPVIEKAVAKNIVVLGVDQHINHPKVISVSNDQYEWAKIQAEWLMKQLGGKGNILWFDALAGAPANDIRSKAFQDVLDKNPEVKVLKHVNADWDQGKAKQLMTQMLSTFPNYDGILTQDGQAVGILQAIQEAGKPLPKGITSDEVVSYLKIWHDINAKDPNNKLNAVIVENPPGIGVDTMWIAVKLLQGKKLKDSALSSDAADPNSKNALLIKPSLVITNDNMEQYYEQYKDKPDTSYIDNVLTEQDIDAYFE
jgi:ribose transport system substrate-binding protein